MRDFNFVDGQNPEFIEDLYQQYLENPESVEPGWRQFFRGFEYAQVPDAPQVSTASSSPQSLDSKSTLGELATSDLIEAYRKLGHLCASNNPIRHQSLEGIEILNKEQFGLNDSDLGQSFKVAKGLGGDQPKLKEVIQHLKGTYCQSIGVEYHYIRDPEFVHWMQNRMEPNENKHPFSVEEKKSILQDLVEAESFETFLHTKYVGAKRFSLEGGTSLIPALETLLDHGGNLGAEEFVIGMAHRGRLNVLVNVLRKNYDAVFTEFESGRLPDEVMGSGDVKYHMGFSSDRETSSGKNVHISLCPNPSHLEFITPVLSGITRSKQEFRQAGDRSKVVPVAIHGDAAFAGQGVVMETVNMSELVGYATGGMIHIVINNQVGFTTHPCDSRSTLYCTDIMKMVETPIFHVNGDDPEAVVHCMHMAMEIRQKFERDVVVDLICYRRYGHNESDEPRFTQPLMYKEIDKHESPATIYASRLVSDAVLKQEEVTEYGQNFKEKLNALLEKTKQSDNIVEVNYLQSDWAGIKVPTDQDIFAQIPTGVSVSTLKEIAERLANPPAHFQPVVKLKRLLKDRNKMYNEEKSMDWGMAENLCYGSLLLEGTPIRLSGQDVRRGTFSHRHGEWYDAETEQKFCPINHIRDGQGQMEFVDSLLSETGVLGFEFGYSMASPKGLCIWEAQFGDFANGAQVIIDQFIVSSESKWQRMSGLVMLLPHGYEGQGPEHSSARLERFLQLCADNNMTVANLTSPAQLFHIMRRQVLRKFRRPMVIMSPKSLLRHPKVTSSFDDLANGHFHEILKDNSDPIQVERVVLCSGKIYYELQEEREKANIQKLSILRLEQIYPFPEDLLEQILSDYAVGVELVWVQEEPKNMGAWFFVREKIEKMNREIRFIGRKESASPATGSPLQHNQEQLDIILSIGEGIK